MPACLIDQALVGNRELKILAQDIKDDADEPLSEIFEHKACEARACESDRLQHAAGSAVLLNPHSPSGGAGTRPAGRLQGSNQLGSDQLGKLSSARDRRVFQ